MSDEYQLQVHSASELILSKPRSRLISRGRQDVATLTAARNLDQLLETRRLAEAGDAHAQFAMGEAYQEGKGVPQNYAEALGWYRKATDQGHLYAISNLGDMFERGEGVAEDRAEALRWYRRAADIALLDLGQDWDPDVIPSVLEKAAEYGYSEAQFALGSISCRARDYAEAVRWYRKAADQGHADAQSELGIAYHEGHGVAQDYVQAHMWTDLAAAASTGDEQKKRFLERDAIAAKMTPEQIAEAQQLACEWTPKNAVL